MADAKPNQHPIVDTPATPAACQADRDAAKGPEAAATQLSEAIDHGNEAAGSR